MSSAVFLGLLAGSLAALGAVELVRAAEPAVRARGPAVLRGAAALWPAIARAGREGRDPGAIERRRLLVGGAALALVAGTVAVGPVAGLTLAAGAPWVVARALRARREQYRRAVSGQAAAMALALADALGGGHSVRSAVSEAARGMRGPAGRELGRVAAELALGARTEEALEGMRERVSSHQIDTIVAGVLLQRRAGGDLARLLRDCARAFEDQARLEGEVRTATAQARFTGLIVVLLPAGGALLAELASPGYLRGLADSFLTAWLGGLALVMQLVAAVLIRRLGRVRA